MATSNGSSKATPGCYAALYYAQALQDFLRRYPVYAGPAQLDVLRAAGYSHLDVEDRHHAPDAA